MLNEKATANIGIMPATLDYFKEGDFLLYRREYGLRANKRPFWHLATVTQVMTSDSGNPYMNVILSDDRFPCQDIVRYDDRFYAVTPDFFLNVLTDQSPLEKSLDVKIEENDIKEIKSQFDNMVLHTHSIKLPYSLYKKIKDRVSDKVLGYYD